jgi:hypothetical protein
MPKHSAKLAGFDQSTLAVYLGALSLCTLVYQSFHDLGLSTLPTLALGIQCFALACLRLKILQTQSVAGISGRTLMLVAVSCALRLCSTCWLNGYIPVDGTGDWLYQVLDILALLQVLNLLYCVFKSHRSTYQEEHDQFNVQFATLLCFVLAAQVHPDLNNRPLFDTLWMTALYVDVVAMMPQLVMTTKNQGEVEALTSHYVGATALSKVVGLIFWFYGFVELAPLDGGFNLAGWAIMAAHVFQVLLLGDFLFYYIRACLSTGSARFQLPTYVDV